MSGRGLGGVAATDHFVLVSDRELDDSTDVFKCLRADTGQLVWAVRYPAPGTLDFGNSPRASPVIDGDRVFLFGAFGNLTAVELATGKILWEMDVRAEFGADDVRKWGMCSTPLLVAGKLIVNPGGKDASLVALDPANGKVLWKAPGKPASYGNFLAGTFGGRLQVIGFDADSLGGWDVADGKRLWTWTPEGRSDFNVPTPMAFGEHLLVAVENNGTLMFRFGEGGKIDPKPVAVNADLAPDTATPVVAAGRVFGAWSRLYCLDVRQNLKEVWSANDPAFRAHISLVATDERVLATTLKGELILFDATGDRFRAIGRVRVLKGEEGCYAHPAFAGKRVYLRGSSSVVCIELE